MAMSSTSLQSAFLGMLIEIDRSCRRLPRSFDLHSLHLLQRKGYREEGGEEDSSISLNNI